jgi:hypothetical protein
MSYSEQVAQATKTQRTATLIARIEFAGVMVFLTGLALLIAILLLG